MLHGKRGRTTGSRGQPLTVSPRPEGRGPKSAGRRKPPLLDPVAPELESEFIRDFLESLQTPRALTVWLLYKYGEHRQLVELGIDPREYENPDRFRRDHWATKLLSKCAGLDTGINTTEVAIAAAEAAERLCKQTNERFLQLLRPDVESGPLRMTILVIRERIAKILGPLPCLLGENRVDRGWSPGRTTSAWGDNLSPLAKYAARPDVTSRALTAGVQLFRDSPLWGAAVLNADGPVSLLPQGFTITEGNVMRLVPKNAKTDRPICFEPHINVRLQLSIGGYIRERLMKHGVNLNDQSINQRRARVGSKHGHLSTIDLRSASDTLAWTVVAACLPREWYMLLDDLRSPKTVWPDGSVRVNEKFSSMGNGFTFELESLIFYAACSAVTPGVTVFGDDIVIPTASYPDCVRVLGWLGFETNSQKSFSTGRFRESCGADMFGGVNVSPVYLRSRLRTVSDAVKFHNRCYEALSRGGIMLRNDHRMLRKWRRKIPAPLGPSGQGDGHLAAPLDEALPERARHGLQGWWFFSYQEEFPSEFQDGIHEVTRKRRFKDVPAFRSYAALCAGLGPKKPRSLYETSVRRRGRRVRRIRILASSWQDTLII